jgi:hypothetical protein
MFKIKDDQSIHVTRGDIGVIEVGGEDEVTGNICTFVPGDKIRIQVYEKKHPENVVLRKVVTVEEEAETIDIPLDKIDTKIGALITQPKEYHYEIELNPDTMPQTLIGHDDISGPKIFKLYPEGADD